jgi:chorismate dehydratase
MFRLGVVSYLNALPLWKPLENRDDMKIVRAVPSRLQNLLDRREIDVALLPIVDYFRHGGTLISDACIGAEGPVRSVLLFSKVSPRDIQSVAVDTSSHTSVALLKVLLADRFGIAPPFFDAAPDLTAMLRNHNAALLIGDAALEAAQNAAEDIFISDLAEVWRDLTGLPFVFAAWIARSDLATCDAQELGDLLSLARDQGTKQIPLLARGQTDSPLPAALIEEYLSHAIQFVLTERHRAAIEEFRRRCAHHHLI